MEWLIGISVPAVIATSFMTAFSFIIGYLLKEQFTEPFILNDLLVRINVLSKQKVKSFFLGWLVHYGVGVIFVSAYHYLFANSDIDPSLVSGVALGAICGVIGVIGWHITLSLHPNPPAIPLKSYYTQLIFAHIIFGITAVISYSLIF